MPVVEMPNGDMVDFPDDMPKEQIKGLIGSKFPELAQAPQGVVSLAASAIPAQPLTLADRIAESLSKRGQNISDIAQGRQAGNQTGFESSLQSVGQAAAGVGDVIGQGIISAAKSGYEQLDPINQDALKLMGKDILKSDIGQLGMKALQTGTEAYGQFKAAYPRAAADLEAAVNIGTVGFGGAKAAPLAMKGVEALTPVVEPIARAGIEAGKMGIEAAASKIPSVLEKAPIPTYKDAKLASQASFNRVEKLGATYSPKLTDSYILKAAELLPDSIPGKGLTTSAAKTARIINENTPAAGVSMTLKDIMNMHQNLADEIESTIKLNGKPNPTGRKLIILQDELENLAKNAPANEVIGGKEGHKALMAANRDWSTSLRLQEIEKIIKRGELSNNKVETLKAGFKNLALNDKKMNSVPAAQKKAIEQVAKDGFIGGTFKNVFGNKFLNTLIGAGAGLIGGVPGSLTGIAAGAATTAASQGIRGSMKMKQINKLRRTMGKDIRRVEAPLTPEIAPQIQPTPPPPRLLLPAPEPVTMVNRQGVARPITAEERIAAQQSRDYATQTGLTPDVRAAQLKVQTNRAYEQMLKQKEVVKNKELDILAKESRVPLGQLIKMSEDDIISLSKIIDENPRVSNLGEALKKATTKRRK